MPTIPGLTAIQPSTPAQEQPADLTEAQIRKIWAGAKEILDFDDYPEIKLHLLDIQGTCQDFVRYGMNDELVGLEDFRVGLASMGLDTNVPFRVHDPGPQLVAEHKKTKKTRVMVTELRGRPRSALLWATASTLISIGETEQPE